MSTILHPVQQHTRIYSAAAAALAVGLLVVLMTTVFGRSGTAMAPPTVDRVHFGHAYRVPCFAGHPTMSIELGRSGCRA
jgi:hypothetical protein